MHVKHKATYIIYSPQSDIPIKYIRPPSTIPTRLNGLQKYLQQEFRFTRTWGKILFNSRTCLGKMSTYENRCKCQVKSRSFILQKIISLIKNCIIIFLQNLLWFLSPLRISRLQYYGDANSFEKKLRCIFLWPSNRKIRVHSALRKIGMLVNSNQKTRFILLIFPGIICKIVDFKKIYVWK